MHIRYLKYIVTRYLIMVCQLRYLIWDIRHFISYIRSISDIACKISNIGFNIFYVVYEISYDISYVILHSIHQISDML